MRTFSSHILTNGKNTMKDLVRTYYDDQLKKKSASLIKFDTFSSPFAHTSE